jgi:citrate lyase subunit beta/citryl-CoA lyase
MRDDDQHEIAQLASAAAAQMTGIEIVRTVLFVPGNRPDRFEKAAASGADLVVLDLEDAVPAGEKATARRAVREFLDRGGIGAVRTNAIGTDWHADDLAAVAGYAEAVMVPKAEAGQAFTALGHRLQVDATPIIALVETASGVLDARAVAESPAVARLALGTFDLASELSIRPTDRSAFNPIRSWIRVASAAADLAGPIDGVFAAVDDDEGLRAEAAWARRLGYSGKLCIHPRQVAIVEQELAPSPEELAWASAIVESAASPDGVTVIDGEMVDRPVVERARRMLAGRHKGSPDRETGPS